MVFWFVIFLFLRSTNAISFPSSYNNTTPLTSGLTISWSILPSGDSISFLLKLQSLIGWISIGFEPDNLGMTNTDIIVAQQVNGTFDIGDFWSVSNMQPRRDVDLGGKNSLLLSRGGIKDDSTWMEFIRPISAEDKYDREIFDTKLNKLVWAFGTTPTMSYHKGNRGYIFLDLFAKGNCINGCYSRGTCSLGNCMCNSGWTGLDCSAVSGAPSDYPVKYRKNIQVKPYFQIFWKFAEVSRQPSISIYVQTEISGWISIGFEPQDRGMTKCDMVVASILPDGKISISDYWSEKIGRPVLDTTIGGTSDIIAQGGVEDGFTWMEFLRPIKSLDPFDRSISREGLTKVVWAFGPESSLTKHNSTNRGFVWVDFFSTGACPNDCSGHGICSDNVCDCNSSYIGDDCSISIYSPIPFPTPTNSFELTPFLNLSWSTNSTHIALALDKKNGKGWVGLSFGAIDGMTGADMIISTFPTGGDSILVQDYYSTDLSTPKLDTSSPDGKNSIGYFRGEVKNGLMRIEVIRPLIAEDKYDKDIVIGASFPVAYAFGETLSLSKHAHQNRQVVNINFATGEGGAALTRKGTLSIAHGVFMFMSWGILLSGGAIWARIFKNKTDIKIMDIPVWFFVHRITQYSGFVFSLIGLIIAFSMVQVHFNTAYHGQLGLTIMIISALQVAFAFFRPHPPTSGEEKSPRRKFFEYQHIWTGRLLIILSIPVIASGLIEINAPTILLDAYLVWILSLIVAFIFYCFYIVFKKRCTTLDASQEEPLAEKKMNKNEENGEEDEIVSPNPLFSRTHERPSPFGKSPFVPRTRVEKGSSGEEEF